MLIKTNHYFEKASFSSSISPRGSKWQINAIASGDSDEGN